MILRIQAGSGGSDYHRPLTRITSDHRAAPPHGSASLMGKAVASRRRPLKLSGAFPAATKGAAMTLQPATSALAFTARLDATQASRAMAAVRAGIGAIGLLAPGRLAWRLFLQDKPTDEATALVLRAAAARDLALGLGAAFAAKRGPGPLRGWMLAAALADGCDALAIATTRSASPAARASAALVSGLSASAELLLAQQLTR
jgi:hypothetical protein